MSFIINNAPFVKTRQKIVRSSVELNNVVWLFGLVHFQYGMQRR